MKRYRNPGLVLIHFSVLGGPLGESDGVLLIVDARGTDAIRATWRMIHGVSRNCSISRASKPGKSFSIIASGRIPTTQRHLDEEDCTPSSFPQLTFGCCMCNIQMLTQKLARWLSSRPARPVNLIQRWIIRRRGQQFEPRT